MAAGAGGGGLHHGRIRLQDDKDEHREKLVRRRRLGVGLFEHPKDGLGSGHDAVELVQGGALRVHDNQLLLRNLVVLDHRGDGQIHLRLEVLLRHPPQRADLALQIKVLLLVRLVRKEGHVVQLLHHQPLVPLQGLGHHAGLHLGPRIAVRELRHLVVVRLHQLGQRIDRRHLGARAQPPKRHHEPLVHLGQLVRLRPPSGEARGGRSRRDPPPARGG